MGKELPDIPRLLDHVIDASRLDDGTREYRSDIVSLLRIAVDVLEIAVQKAPLETPALRARLNHVQTAVDWLQRMTHVYSTLEWPMHVRMAARDARSLYEILEQRLSD